MDPITIREGLTKVIKVAAPEGAESPPAGTTVRVHYVGTLAKDGKQFDSSRDRGSEFCFTLGSREVILGWDLGVATMKKGERCVLTCAPEFGYGSSGAGGVIPPNATLNFDVELIGFGPPEPMGAPQYLAIAMIIVVAGAFLFRSIKDFSE